MTSFLPAAKPNPLAVGKVARTARNFKTRNGRVDLNYKTIQDAFAKGWNIPKDSVAVSAVPRDGKTRGDVVYVTRGQFKYRVYYAFASNDTDKTSNRFLEGGVLIRCAAKRGQASRWEKHFTCDGLQEGDFYVQLGELPSGDVGFIVIDLRNFREVHRERGESLIVKTEVRFDTPSHLIRPMRIDVASSRKVTFVASHKPGLLAYL